MERKTSQKREKTAGRPHHTRKRNQNKVFFRSIPRAACQWWDVTAGAHLGKELGCQGLWCSPAANHTSSHSSNNVDVVFSQTVDYYTTTATRLLLLFSAVRYQSGSLSLAPAHDVLMSKVSTLRRTYPEHQRDVVAPLERK